MHNHFQRAGGCCKPAMRAQELIRYESIPCSIKELHYQVNAGGTAVVYIYDRPMSYIGMGLFIFKEEYHGV